jgi:hypothetical protein
MLRIFNLFTVFTIVYGYSLYKNDFPNGDIVIPSTIELGHPNRIQKSYTSFAKLYVNQGYRWTKTLCYSDSDRDGQTNGIEMGDPCCVWTLGSIPTFTIGLSDPNNPESKTQNIIPTCL